MFLKQMFLNSFELNLELYLNAVVLVTYSFFIIYLFIYPLLLFLASSTLYLVKMVITYN